MAGSGSSLLDLLQIQIGKQTNFTTPLAAPTAKLMGVTNLTLPPGVTAMLHHDRRGSIAPGYLANVAEVRPEGIALEQLGLYEDSCYLLDNFFGEATPSGAGPYTRDYAAPIGAVPAPRILTMVYGDATNCYAANGLLASKLSIKGENGKPMTITAECIARDIGTDALAALSDRTVNVAMGDHMAVYIDAWGGTIGSTAIAATAYAYELTIDAKRKGDIYLGALSAASYHEDDGAEGWTGSLKLSLELNAASKAQLDALIASTAVYQRLIRLASTSGTNVLRFDFAGMSEKAPDLFSDRDGVATFDVELTGMYNPTLGNWCKVQSVNSVSALV
jgi:hypothetical protein